MQKSQVGVYYHNQPSTDPPAYFIDISDARELKLNHQGWFINHGEGFRLKADAPVDESLLSSGRPDMRDASCRMGPSVIQANAEGMTWAHWLTLAWA